jgi:tetratricopeptide (TPR) repeat protein
VKAAFLLCTFLALSTPVAGERIPYIVYDTHPFRLNYEDAGDYSLVELIDGALEAMAASDNSRVLYLFNQLRLMQSSEPMYHYVMSQMAYLLNEWEVALAYASMVPSEYEQGRASLIRGASLLQLHRHDEALDVFQQELKKAPQSLEIRQWLATTMMIMRRYDQAAETYKELLSMDPSALDMDSELKTIMQTPPTQGPERVSRRLMDVMQTRMTSAMLPPMQAATVHYLVGNRDRAIGIMNEAVAARPDDPELHYRLGLFYDHMGDKMSALPHYEKASALSPDDPDLLNNMAVIAMQLGQYDLANKSFQRAIELRPDFAEAFRNRARIHIDREEWSQAVYTANESLLIDPESEPARMMAAFGSFKLKYHEDVINFLDPLLTAGIKQADAWFLAASSAKALGRTKDAERFFRSGLALDRENIIGLNNLADLILSKRRPTKEELLDAVSLAEEAFRLTKGQNTVVEKTLRDLRERVEAMSAGSTD